MPKLANVNTADIRAAIQLGCRTMCGLFNADDNDRPFFQSEVLPNPHLGPEDGTGNESHVPGRHLNALLSAQDALGLEIPEEAVRKHAEAAFFSYSGAVPFPLQRQTPDGPVNRLSVHDMREGLHALYALARYRQCDRARELAERNIAAIRKYWSAGAGLNTPKLEALGVCAPDRNFISGIARSIGPLVKFFRATGYAPALELAIDMKNKAIAEFYTPSGTFDPAHFGGHIHSVTCVLSSLAQLADCTSDAQLMLRVLAFYDNGLWRVRDELGWAMEGDGPGSNTDRGETNSSGDILETALILGKWGHTRCFADAELILRGHLLPSQLRDVSFIQQPDNPDNRDSLRDIADRHLGAFGFPAPYGHQPVGQTKLGFWMDIVGGTVASLCEAYRSAARYEGGMHWVHLLFDHETPDILVRSAYTHGALSVTAKRRGPLFVRLPPWADPESVTVQGAQAGPLSNGYLLIPKPALFKPVAIRYPLPERAMTLHHRERDIRVRLRGDEVIAMDNFGMPYTFFDPIA